LESDYSNGILINDNPVLHMLLFADDEALISDSEIGLQRALYYIPYAVLQNSLE
jgi:hypothetical protein